MVAAVDPYEKFLLGDVQIMTRGFVYVKENEDLLNQAKQRAKAVIEEGFDKGLDVAAVKNHLKDELSKFLYQKTKRRPMVLPTILSV